MYSYMMAKRKYILLWALLALMGQSFPAAALACASDDISTMQGPVTDRNSAARVHGAHLASETGDAPVQECCEQSACVMVHCFTAASVFFDAPVLITNELAGLRQSEYSVFYLNAEVNPLLRPPISR